METIHEHFLNKEGNGDDDNDGSSSSEDEEVKAEV
jgi:hypothetical protein